MVLKDDAKKGIKRLVDLYEKYKESGDIKNFEGKEENTKTTFILPLFKTLGWDVHNEKNIEVVSEERVLRGAVDYAFRLDGQNKFFVEAKPIGRDLRLDAKQAIEYGVNSGNTWVVLTNFESIIIFNCEWKEKDWWKNALFYPPVFECKNYINEFDKLWLLSKESIAVGKLDEWATNAGKKVPRTPIDKELLSKFLEWRLKLSKDISKKYDYSIEDIEELVQKLLIRLLFIKNCEDRGFETNYKLLPVAEAYKTHKKGMLKLLRRIFDYYENTYDSGIFENGEIDKINFDEGLLSEILNGLYFTPDNYKYNFNVIPADVMGNLYEQYLGNILKKTPERTKLKEGKAHRKEQGIYYTPTYIVDYIVRNTLGELLKNKKVNASKIRVLDPACGSGSFLVKAFDVLNEHYSKDKMYGQKTLTGYSTKEKILQNNIFGVDLDKQAVEIAQLNLLLRIAEKGQKLPLLKQNIKCGNSLIDDEKIAPKTFFKWEEQFADIIKEGGFDVVIGNPPYVNIYLLSQNEKEVKYYQEKYFSAYKKFDLYVLFIEKAIKLLKDNGYFSFIIPDKFLSQPYGLNLRKFILDNCCIEKIVDLTKFKIFEEATVDNVILVLKKEKNGILRNKNKIAIIAPEVDPTQQVGIIENIREVSQSVYKNATENLFRLDIDERKIKLREKIEHGSRFISQFCYVNWGARSGDIKTFVVREKKNSLCKPMLDGRDINRYRINWDNKYLIYDKEKLYNPMFEELFENDKLIIRDVNAKEGIKATFDNERYYTEHTVSLCLLNYQLENVKRRGLSLDKESIQLSKKFSLKYILGLIDSKLVTFYFKTFIGCGLHVYPDNIRALPIKLIPESQQQPIIRLVDKMLSLNKRFNELGDKKTDERTRIEEEIKKTDAEINELVYKIYGITEEEKKIIEESLK